MRAPRTFLRHNLHHLRHAPLSEISGSLGDLGTFLPILIALSTANRISLSTTLVFTGIYNILTGLFFGIPLPVQPMKAIAAVALVRNFEAGEVAAAGIFVSAVVGVAAVLGLLTWINDHVPVPVVKGIQVGAGLSLCMSGGTTIMGLHRSSWVNPSWADNYIWAIVVFAALIVVSTASTKGGRWGRVPFALIIFVIGLIFAGIRVGTAGKAVGSPGLRLWKPYVQVPRGVQWAHGILEAGLGQLPLTTLNSIIAVVQLASDLLPEIETPTVTAIGLSVSAMNLVGCWFGAMPACHGSGGLAAQYRFGARSGASIMILGLFKLIVGLIFGESLSDLLAMFPKSMLAVMVIGAGLELASVGESLNTSRARDINKNESLIVGERGGAAQFKEAESKRRWTVFLITVALLVAFKNDAIGFLAGLFCHWMYQLTDRWIGGRSNGRIRLESSNGEEEPLADEHGA